MKGAVNTRTILETIPNIKNLESNNFFLLSGPCVVETYDITFEIAEKLKDITDKLKIPFVFKASYRKANRSSISSFSGIGDEKALDILLKIKEDLKVPIVTDIHSEAEALWASAVADILQIPAFLCRQTDLLVAAAKTGKVVNIKKGQFLSAESMRFAVTKVIDSGNSNVLVTDRGTMFGYQDLIVDYRTIPIMQKCCNVPVILDITHSLQVPNQTEGVTGGTPNMIETIAKAGVAVGVDGLFMETHPNPKEAKSDGANMIKLSEVESLLTRLLKIRSAII